MKIRQSHIKLFHRCPYAFYLAAISQIEGDTRAIMEKGIERHKKVEKMLSQGEIPQNLAIFFKHLSLNLENAEFEKYFEAKITDTITITGTLDFVQYLGDTAYILDWKFSQSEHSLNYYTNEKIQPAVYSFLLFKNDVFTDLVKFYYIFPDFQKIIPFEFTREEAEEQALSYITPVIEAIKENKFEPCFSACGSCLYKKHCEYMRPETVDITKFEKKFEITQDNAARVYQFIEKASAIIDKLKSELKEKLIAGDISPIELPDGRILQVKQKSGRKQVSGDIIPALLEAGVDPMEILKNTKISYSTAKRLAKDKDIDIDKYTTQGEPFYILEAK